MYQKTCFKCSQTKPCSEFYKHPQMGDGYLGKCKSCTKKDTFDRQAILSKDPAWVKKELARHREKSARARKLGKISDKETQKRARLSWQARNKNKRLAHSKVHSALRMGKLTRKPCEVCGDYKSQAHHDDYTKPLDVMWLCPKHHGERHVELNRLARLSQ